MRAAVDLFGGRNAIEKRMTQVTREHLRQLGEADLIMLEEALYLDDGSLREIVQRRARVEFRVFDKLASPLGIQMQEILGTPIWTDHERKYWEKESKKKLMSSLFYGPEAEVPLDLYVAFRATEELCS